LATDVAWYRVGDPSTPTVQAAIDAAIASGRGGVVYVPPGQHYQPGTIQVPPTPNPEASLILRGDGPGISQLIGRFSPFGYDVLSVRRSRVVVERLTITIEGGPIGSRGVVVGGGPAAVSDVTIRDCIAYGTGLEALLLSGPLSNVLVERCVFSANFNPPALATVGRLCRHVTFVNTSFDHYRGSAIALDGCRNVTIADGNVESANDGGRAPFMTAVDAEDCHLTNVWFEEVNMASTTQWFLDLGGGCHGWTIIGCYFVRKEAPGGRRLIKLARLGGCAEGIPGPVSGVLILNPTVHTNFTEPAEPGHIEINDSCSEVCVVGGVVRGGFPPMDTHHPLDIVDATSKSTWIGSRRWRPPLVGATETPNSGSLGDLLARPNRGLEMWNARATEASWIPMSVNRYANEQALQEVPATSRNRGTLAWLDTPPAGTPNLRVWDGSTWRGVVYS